MNGRVLVADDQSDVRSYLSGLLRQGGYSVIEAKTAEECLEILEREGGSFLCVVLDVDFGTGTLRGSDAIVALRERWPHIPCILLTASGTTEEVVESVKKGATAFLEKGLYVGEILPIAIGQVAYVARLRQELARLRSEVRVDWRAIRLLDSGQDDVAIVGDSEAITEAREQAEALAGSDGAALILGERGTGRTHLATHIHLKGDPGRKLYHVHCGGLGEDWPALLRPPQPSPSDEEGEPIPGDDEARTVVVRDLHLLDGSGQERLLDVVLARPGTRWIGTGSPELRERVSGGDFLPALFEAFGGTVIELPPLRERPEDVGPLGEHLARSLSAQVGRPDPVTFDEAARNALAAYRWPGNVAELRALVLELAIGSRDGTIEKIGLPPHILVEEVEAPEMSPAQLVRRRAVLEALAAAGGDHAVAAGALGFSEDELREALGEVATDQV